MKNVFFTINTNKRGFTDQLSQFSVYYALGRYMGFSYVHTELKTYRSNPVIYSRYVFISKLYNFLRIIKNNFFPSNEIFNQIGINPYFSKKLFNRKDFGRIIDIRFDEKFATENNIESTESLKKFIMGALGNNPQDINEKILVRFIHVYGMEQVWTIKSLIPDIAEYLDFTEIYLKSRSAGQIKSLYKENSKTKILVHIRQGDIALIKTPWNTFINIPRSKSYSLREFDKLDKPGVKSKLQPEEFLIYLKGLLEHYGDKDLSVIIFSDGYARSLDLIIRRIDELNLSKHKKEQLLKSFGDYEQKQFEIFKALTNIDCVIGESDEKLQQLLYSTVEADIVICSDQQYMMPKLTNIFCKDDKPAVLVISKNQNTKINNNFFNNNKFIFDQLEKPDYSKLVGHIY